MLLLFIHLYSALFMSAANAQVNVRTQGNAPIQYSDFTAMVARCRAASSTVNNLWLDAGRLTHPLELVLFNPNESVLPPVPPDDSSNIYTVLDGPTEAEDTLFDHIIDYPSTAGGGKLRVDMSDYRCACQPAKLGNTVQVFGNVCADDALQFKNNYLVTDCELVAHMVGEQVCLSKHVDYYASRQLIDGFNTGDVGSEFHSAGAYGICHSKAMSYQKLTRVDLGLPSVPIKNWLGPSYSNQNYQGTQFFDLFGIYIPRGTIMESRDLLVTYGRVGGSLIKGSDGTNYSSLSPDNCLIPISGATPGGVSNGTN